MKQTTRNYMKTHTKPQASEKTPTARRSSGSESKSRGRAGKTERGHIRMYTRKLLVKCDRFRGFPVFFATHATWVSVAGSLE